MDFLQQNLLITTSQINQDWQSTKIPETSVLYFLRNSQQNYWVYHLEESSLSVNKDLRILGTLWENIIPGFEGEVEDENNEEEEKVDMEDKAKRSKSRHIIPSSHLFLYRKNLHKTMKGIEDDNDMFQNTQFWIKFGEDLIKMTSNIISCYLSIILRQNEDAKAHNCIEIFGVKLTISESRRLNLLIDFRYLNILIQNYNLLISLAYLESQNQIFSFYLLSIIVGMRELSKIMLKLEIWLSNKNPENESIINSASYLGEIFTAEFPEEIDPYDLPKYLKKVNLEAERDFKFVNLIVLFRL